MQLLWFVPGFFHHLFVKNSKVVLHFWTWVFILKETKKKFSLETQPAVAVLMISFELGTKLK